MQQIQDEFKGIAPLFGRNLLSILVTDIANLVIVPGWQTVAQFFVDLLYFLLLPIVGGVLAQSAEYHWNFDELTYIHANMTKADLWQPSMIFGKTLLYGALGRPITFGLNDSTSFNITGDPETDQAINDLVDNTGNVIVSIVNNTKSNDPTNPF